MDDTHQDDNLESDTTFVSSTNTTDTSFTGADTDTNADEVVTLKKSEYDSFKQEIASVKEALKIEREKTKRHSLSEVDGDEAKPKKEYDTYRKFREKELAEDRLRYEEDVKKDILKKFPSLAAVNDYGINEEVLENYRDILEGRIKRGFHPRTREDVFTLVERAVRMTKPELFIQRQEELGEGYSGMSRGTPVEQETSVERLSPKERAFHDFVTKKEQMNK